MHADASRQHFLELQNLKHEPRHSTESYVKALFHSDNKGGMHAGGQTKEGQQVRTQPNKTR